MGQEQCGSSEGGGGGGGALEATAPTLFATYKVITDGYLAS